MNQYLPKANGWSRVENKIRLDENRTRQETRLWTVTTLVLAMSLGAVIHERPVRRLALPRLGIGETRVDDGFAVSIPLKTEGVRFSWLLDK